MKIGITTLLITLFCNFCAHSQESSVNQGMSFGFQLAQYQQDFGVGLNLSSPLFFHNSCGIRLRANSMNLQHIQNAKTVWTSYTNVSLGFIGVGGIVNDKIRLYGEGGYILILPTADFSEETTVSGGYGLFGFEFFMQPFINYFIEIGGVGTGAIADRVPGKPIYSNGMTIGTGFRFTLK